MKKPTKPQLRALALAMCVAGGSFAGQAHALLINVDLAPASAGDRYNTGPGVLGTASSVWNELNRAVGYTNQSLLDDTGAASSVNLSYTRIGSVNQPGITGAFATLGTSHVNSGAVTLAGLTVGASYDLVIFSGWSGTPTWQVGAGSAGTSFTSDWSSLAQGTQYARFTGVVGAGGSLTFTPNANPTGGSGASEWSAFQLNTTNPSTSVPEPATLALMTAGLLGALSSRRKKA